MLQGPSLLVLSDTLPLSTPLAPLLAADGPESFSLVEPSDEETRVVRGQTLTLRFNRPVISAVRVGRDLEAGLLQFDPPIAGAARWTSRASLTFTPDAAALRATVTSHLTFGAALRSLAGESLPEGSSRTVAFDATPRLDLPQVRRRIAAEAPIRLAYQGIPAAEQVGREVMLFENNGLRRTLAFTARAATPVNGLGFVDLVPGEALSPGSRLTVVYAPSQGQTWGDSPGYFSVEVIPRPQLDGVGCAVPPGAAVSCDYGVRPGRVVDFAESFSLRSSHALGPVTPADVTLVPAVEGLRVTVSGRALTLHGDWTPGQVYELRLPRLLADDGAALMPVAPLAIRSRGLAPAVGTLRESLTFERDLVRPLPITGVHAETGVVRASPVPVGAEGIAALQPGQPRSDWRSTRLSELLPTMRANRWGRGQYAWSSVGDMALVAVDATSETQTMPRLVQRTQLGISSLRTSVGEHLVWVTSLQDGSAVADAAVELHDPNGRIVARGRTAADGIARLAEPPDTGSRFAVVVRTASDRAVLVVAPAHAVGAAQLGLQATTGTTTPSAVLGSVVLDRGAYRPGETVRTVIFLRTLRGSSLAAARRQRATVILMGPSGVVARSPGRADAYGQLTAEFPLGAAAPLGEYSVQVEATPGQVAASRTLSVAEFRPPRLRVDLRSPRSTALHGEALPMQVASAYLFGAPVAQGNARWTLSRAEAPAAPERWARYQFGPVDAPRAAGTLAEGELTLSAAGEGTIALSPTVAQGGAETHSLEVTVRDPGGEETTSTRSITVMPAAWRVGVQPMAPWLAAGSRIEGRAIALDAAGAVVAGRRVEVTITREGWRGWFERHENAEEGTPELVAQRARTREIVHRCEVTTAGDEAQACGFVPSGPGSYLVEVRSEDEAHRVTRASTRTYVAGPSEQPERDPPGAPITLTPLRADWYVGERARIAFECPWPEAQALITVVRERIIHQ